MTKTANEIRLAGQVERLEQKRAARKRPSAKAKFVAWSEGGKTHFAMRTGDVRPLDITVDDALTVVAGMTAQDAGDST